MPVLNRVHVSRLRFEVGVDFEYQSPSKRISILFVCGWRWLKFNKVLYVTNCRFSPIIGFDTRSWRVFIQSSNYGEVDQSLWNLSKVWASVRVGMLEVRFLGNESHVTRLHYTGCVRVSKTRSWLWVLQLSLWRWVQVLGLCLRLLFPFNVWHCATSIW